MEYPFGFEGFEAREGSSDLHPTTLELQSYCDRSLHSFADIGRDEFMKIENHAFQCDSCLMTLINDRIQQVADSRLRNELCRNRNRTYPSVLAQASPTESGRFQFEVMPYKAEIEGQTYVAMQSWLPADRECIASRAYELWEQRGCPEGSPEDDWLMAEDQLSFWH
jgi:hypothetical protein